MYWRVFFAYGFQLSIMNDQGGQMTSTLWRQLCQSYGIAPSYFWRSIQKPTGQTKNTNKVMKNYLRAYINHMQNNWIDHLPMAEFAANNYINTSTRITLFFADNSFHLWIGIKPRHTSQDTV